MTLLSFVLLVDLIWHGFASVAFLLRPGWTIAIFTTERPVQPMAVHLTRFLGGLNVADSALAAFCLAAAPADPRPILLFFALANASQFVLDVGVHREGVTNGRFVKWILVPDGAVAVLNLVAIGLVGAPHA